MLSRHSVVRAARSIRNARAARAAGGAGAGATSGTVTAQRPVGSSGTTSSSFRVVRREPASEWIHLVGARLGRSVSTEASPAVSAAEGTPRDAPRAAPPRLTADKLLADSFADPVAAGQLLFTPGLLSEAATKDAAAQGYDPAAYLTSVRANIVSFLDGAEEVDGIPRVVNHDDTLAVLRQLGFSDSKGLLTLLTGPRSVGKTLMLRKVAAELSKDVKHPRRVVLLDARECGANLTHGFIAYLTTQPNRKLLDLVLHDAPASVVTALTLAGKLAAPALIEKSEALENGALPRLNHRVTSSLSPLVDGLSKYERNRNSEEVTLSELLGAFLLACKKAGEHPVIVIDEANHALATAEPELKRRTLDLLQLLTRVTKQHREATVVLATSEHGLPFRLRALGYTKGHIGDVIVAQELPPAVMKDLLVRTWGCGEHLATALLKLYGGHVLHASAALRRLGIAADPATMPGTAAITTIVSDPDQCLSVSTLDAAGVPEAERADFSKRVQAAMRALAVDGYVPLASAENKVAEVISLANVGLVVPHGAMAASVPPRAWAARAHNGERAKAVLLPSSHIMRLLIADKVFPPPMAGGDAAPLA